jgi:hypothetical protein
MTHHFAEGARKRLLNKDPIGDIEVETDNEHIAADHIAEEIRVSLGLTWDKVSLELNTFGNNWQAPGEIINLDFLLHHVKTM